MIKGYETIMPLDDIEKNSIWLLIGAIEILIVAYYTFATSVLKWIWESKVIKV